MSRESWYSSKYFVIIFFPMVFFIILYEYNTHKREKNRSQYDGIVNEYRSRITSDKLEKMPFEFSEGTENIQDFHFEEFCHAMEVSHIGGFNHPLTKNKLYIYDMNEGTGFVFEIIFALDNGKTPGVNVDLVYYENNEYKGGYRCRCRELDAWGKAIGMFD